MRYIKKAKLLTAKFLFAIIFNMYRYIIICKIEAKAIKIRKICAVLKFYKQYKLVPTLKLYRSNTCNPAIKIVVYVIHLAIYLMILIFIYFIT